MNKSVDQTPKSDSTVWALVGVCGDGQAVRRITVGGSHIVVGRSESCDLQLNFQGVSKKHARVRMLNGRLLVEDAGSTNGTFVNGLRISEETALQPADVVQFANAPFKVGCEVAVDFNCTQAEMVVDHAMALMQFDRLMSQRALTPHFQPIVNINDEQIVGFEVLARSRVVGLETAKTLFDAAALVQQEVELSRLMRDEGVRAGLSMPNMPELFLNTHPDEMDDQRLLRSLRELRSRHPGIPVTLEIHEKVVTNPTTMRELRGELAHLDMKLAYDDFGAGQARLLELVEVPPHYLKFDISLVKNIHTASTQRQQMLGALVRMVVDLGIVPLAEGIELAEEAEICRQVGFVLAQGYLYGRPAGPTDWNLNDTNPTST